MEQRVPKSGPNLLIACSLVFWLVALAGVRAGSPPGPMTRAGGENPAVALKAARATASPVPQETPAAPAAKPVTYIGEKACLDCHDDSRKGYQEGPMHRAMDPRTPAAHQGCESCHGPGSLHADDPVLHPIRDFKTTPAKEVTEVCESCHSRGDHALWEGSQHESRGLTCTTCHSTHDYKSETAELKAETQLTLCAKCHADKAAKERLSTHMPIAEGKMECTTCHNPHGSTNVKLLRVGDSVSDACTSCHADKRGPFLWEHAPSRDGCVTCHDPHGSSNENLLVARTPMLCQRCHVGTRHPATIYDAAAMPGGSAPSLRVAGRSCVECHADIHGSDHPSGQRFIR